jgi:hypothetical protein
MKNIAPVVGLLGAFLFRAAMAETVTTALFTIDVPDGWTIENDESSTVLASGGRVVDRMPMPFLSIQYCTSSSINAATSESSELSPCTHPCSEDSLPLKAKDDKTRSSVTKQVTSDGITELRTEKLMPQGGAALAALSCSPIGQVYVGLVSDESVEQARASFNAVLSSIRWKQP